MNALIYFGGLFLPILFLYLRHKPWAAIPRRLRIVMPLAGQGVLLLGLGSGIQKSELSAWIVELGLALMFPLLCLGLEVIMVRISQIKQGRNFYLGLQHSADLRRSDIRISSLDRILSFCLLLLIFFLFAM
ncbi:MAG: hypothetical protein AAFQ68_26435, partial [Bacteroidota bacterium]